MGSALFDHNGDSGGVHLLEVDTHVPDREWSARQATDDPGWVVSGLESPSIMAVFSLAEVPGSTIPHGPEVRNEV